MCQNEEAPNMCGFAFVTLKQAERRILETQQQRSQDGVAPKTLRAPSTISQRKPQKANILPLDLLAIAKTWLEPPVAVL